jgi:hypothetical protein
MSKVKDSDVDASALKDFEYEGNSYSYGLVVSFPLTSIMTLETEINILRRSLEQEDWMNYTRKLDEWSFNIPITLRVASAPYGKFAFFAELGTQLGFPGETVLNIEGADSSPLEITDRTSPDVGWIFGGGFSFKAGVIFNIGYRFIMPGGYFSDGDYGVGRLTQHEIGLTIMH